MQSQVRERGKDSEDVMTEAEIAEMPLLSGLGAKECRQPPKAGKGKEIFSPGTSRKNQP